MNGPTGERREIRRRLAALDPLFRDLSGWIIGRYAKAGILDAMPDGSFPVADAVFSRKTRGLFRRPALAYSPRGPVHLSITRPGRLVMAGQDQDNSIADAVAARAILARPQDFPWAQEGTGTSPVPHAALFLLDPVTSDLYIRVTDPATGQTPVLVRPIGPYARENAKLFIAAFEAAR